MWVLKMVGRRRAGNLRHRRLRRACPYSHTCDSRQARLPTKDQNGTTSRPFFLGGKKRIAPGPSPSPEQGCTAPGTLSASRPVARQRATTHSLWNKIGRRGWVLKRSGNVEPRSLRHRRLRRLVPTHTSVIHDKHGSRRKTKMVRRADP